MTRPAALLILILVAACGYEEPLPKLVAAASDAVVLATASQAGADEVVPNSYIVTFRSDLLPGRRGSHLKSFLSEYRRYYAPLAERYLSDARVVDINYIDQVDLADPGLSELDADLDAPPALQLAIGGRRGIKPLMATIAEVKFRDAEGAAAALAEWEGEGRIWFAEPNYLSRLAGTFDDIKAKYAPDGKGLWWHENMKLPAALDALINRNPPVTETFEPVIAVLDSGLDVEHEAFNNPSRVFANPAPGQSGCVGDTNGCDTTLATKGSFGVGIVKPYGADPAGRACLTDEDSSKNCPHGTHVAGIVAANWQGSYGGVCPFCKILPVKIIAKQGKGGTASDSAILNGMKYLTRFVSSNELVVRVVNSSFGKYSRSRAVSVLVAVLAAADVVVVGAASNEDSMQRTYPSSLSPAIAVAALTQDNRKAQYSNYGPWVDVAAPGGEGQDAFGIVSANPGGGPINKSGTSMATPMVAGVAGFVLALDPKRSGKALRNSIVLGADPRIYNADVANGFNRNNYYPLIPGENTRRPLLGTGIVDIECAIKGDCKTGLLTNGKERVTQGCSTIRNPYRRYRASEWWLLLLVPLAVAAAFRRRP